MIDLGWDATAACVKLFVLESLPVPERRKDSAVYSATTKPKQGHGKPEVGTKKIAPGCPRLRRVISPDGNQGLSPSCPHRPYRPSRPSEARLGRESRCCRETGGRMNGRTDGNSWPIISYLELPSRQLRHLLSFVFVVVEILLCVSADECHFRLSY